VKHKPIAPDSAAAPVADPHPLRWTVEPAEPDAAADAPTRRRLDRWISDRLPDRARNRIQQDIAAGRVRVNGVAEPARRDLRDGDQIEYHVPPELSVKLLPESIPLTIVFEDDHIIVINKPAGLVVHPAPGHASGTLANALLAHCGPSLEGVGGEGRWGIVHRLDAGTSGLLVAAKTAPAYEALVAAMAERQIGRKYLGLAVGRMQEETGTIDRPIGRRRSDRKRMGIVKDGREARTDWRVVLQSGGLALLALTLHTGRTHQIRVHLQAIGRPILGDADYGWTRPRSLESIDLNLRPQLAAIWPDRPMLHATRLELTHPIESERALAFDATPPADFGAVAEMFWGASWRGAAKFS
jgi:23S rRNA pseudouridine1911/1915/1917 synthase